MQKTDTVSGEIAIIEDDDSSTHTHILIVTIIYYTYRDSLRQVGVVLIVGAEGR